MPISTHPIPIIRELRRRRENIDWRGDIFLGYLGVVQKIIDAIMKLSATAIVPYPIAFI